MSFRKTIKRLIILINFLSAIGKHASKTSNLQSLDDKTSPSPEPQPARKQIIFCDTMLHRYYSINPTTPLKHLLTLNNTIKLKMKTKEPQLTLHSHAYQCYNHTKKIALRCVVCEAVIVCMSPLATIRPTPQKIYLKYSTNFKPDHKRRDCDPKIQIFQGKVLTDIFPVFKELFNLENMNTLEFLLFHTLPKSVRAPSQPYLQKTETRVVGFFQITNRR